jgi:hypothetical protein
MTSRSELQPPTTAPRNTAGLDIYAQGVAQIEPERKRLGITEQMLQRNRRGSISKPF